MKQHSRRSPLLTIEMLHFTSDFPRGLRVLVVDPDAHFRVQSEHQLRQCAYSVTTTGSVSEAVALLRSVQQQQQPGSSNGGAISFGPFDVMLVEARLLLDHVSHHSRKLVKLCRTLPFILMSASPSPDEVMLGIKLGASEVLEKPLCQLKLKNIWQHTVRRMMMAGGLSNNNSSKKSPSALGSGRASAPCTSRSSQDIPTAPCSLLGSPGSDDAVGVPAAWAEDEEPMLAVPHSPLTDGLFSSPAASSASHDFLMEPPYPQDFQAAGGVCQGPYASSLSHHAGALPTANCAWSALPDRQQQQQRRSVEQTPFLRGASPDTSITSHNSHQQQASAVASAAPLPPPPPPPEMQSARGGQLDLPPPPPLCAPGMPWCPPAEPLPPGTEWGMPMNPMAVAPGICPPIFPEPAMGAPVFPTPSCAPQSHQYLDSTNTALMPLPMHLLSAACDGPGAAPADPLEGPGCSQKQQHQQQQQHSSCEAGIGIGDSKLFSRCVPEL
ncbi:hypothetical protein DUNSADRAFT_18417 [Dunaliella salina]|uniref:Response regulatory domain-containing protein n=1 Tax=Dunaliella salina TaxID=3046 RepID=A0ABQ7GZ50_DUNSA|nr:hypothetical protein DUNSADRAFT_18417 [Dunaliella salina]|eukprot:KAF5839874.1 hypothetical protein DUNSADRAFT_18417 [Dunaliella salina]